MQRQWTVPSKDSGVTLGTFLHSQLQGRHYSRRGVKRLVDAGYLRRNGTVERFSNVTVTGGDRLTLLIPDEGGALDGRPFASRILYEDDVLCVYDKPAGIACDAKGIVAHFAREGRRVRLVHRLDKETSGLLLLAKDLAAEEVLTDQFRKRQVQKQYVALVHGCPERASGSVANSLGPVQRMQGQARWGPVAEGGHYAETDWRLMKRGQVAALLVVFPRTGRTHQIRAHLSGIGHPILGDSLYGRHVDSDVCVFRQMLHAHGLVFWHPTTQKEMRMIAPLPKDMRTSIRKLFSETSGKRCAF